MGFFVKRPVLATVIALIFVLIGVLASTQLAVEQYPSVAPPQVQITAVYPGASPETLETTRRRAAGARDERHRRPALHAERRSARGLMQLQVFFEPGTDLDLAAVEVNNRAKRVEALLPQEVLRGPARGQDQPADPAGGGAAADDPRFDADLHRQPRQQPGHQRAQAPARRRRRVALRRTVRDAPVARPRPAGQVPPDFADVGNAVREQNQNFPVGEIGQSPSPTTASR